MEEKDKKNFSKIEELKKKYILLKNIFIFILLESGKQLF